MTDAGYRLSPQQRHLWLAQQPDGSVLRSSCSLLLEGDLDRGALAAALRELVERHEILRTTFQRPPGHAVPLQMVHARVDDRWAGIDLSPADPAGPALRPEDLERGPVLRARLSARSEGGHLLTLDLPALCADGRSLDNLAAELAEAYAGAVAGRRGEREVFQYARFSEWQNLLAEEAGGESGKAFWRRRLPAGFAARGLPFVIRPAAPSPFEPRSRRRAIPRDLAAGCSRLAEQTGSSLETVLLGSWQALLWRLTGERDIVVGALFPCREYDVLAGAVGLMAKSLPVACRFDEGLDGSQLLRRVAAELQEVAERADDLGLEEAMAEAGGGEGPPCLPFAFESETVPAPLRAGGLVLTRVARSCAVDRFHLRLLCAAGPSGVEIELGLDPARYDEADVDRLGGWLGTLLAGLAGTPDRPLADLDLLTEAERREVLAAGQGPEAAWPAGLCVHEMFERTARRLADQPAVVQGERRLTHGQLLEESTRLAARLRAAGVGPESPVGLCLERSIEMVVGLLGILRAGGAYVPLDPGLPSARLLTMTESIGVGHVVTLSPQAALFGEGIVKILLDEAGAAPAPGEPAAVLPGNLAYVLFTSGSTGTPKGVAIEHRQLVHYTGAIRERLGLAEGARYGVVSTIGADLGNTTLFPSLTAGGCLCLASEEEATDADRFRGFMQRNRVDALKITPTHLAALLGSAPSREALPGAVLVLGGEAADPRWLADLRALAPELRLLNHYGPTETTVGVTTFEMTRPEGPVPLGRPLGGGRVYLLDGRLRPVPPGVPGEIHIGGPGVARGYARLPAETAEKLIPDPFATAPGERLYRSGDLGRLLPTGDLLFLGRRDHQIKLRGFRVEMGEIESVLRSLPGVEDAVAAVREDAPGERRLVAYFAARAGQQPDPKALRRELRSRLPEPMVPAVLVPLKALPRTGSGKVDRRALPAPGQAALRELVAPRTPLEEIVAGLWAEVLKVERVGVEDDFFDLGGHSLLAIQIVSRLKETFRVDIPLRAVLLAGSVARLCQTLIESETHPGQIDKITRAIQKVRAMSPEEIQRTLAAKRGDGKDAHP